jgi:hypothetical protein
MESEYVNAQGLWVSIIKASHSSCFRDIQNTNHLVIKYTQLITKSPNQFTFFNMSAIPRIDVHHHIIPPQIAG